MAAQNIDHCFTLGSTSYSTYGEPLDVTFQDLGLPIDTLSYTKQYIFLTVFHWEEDQFDPKSLEVVKNECLRRDDVWNPRFLDAIVLYTPGRDCPRIDNYNLQIIVHATQHALPQGPYVAELSTGHIFHVWRQCGDTHDAFVAGNITVPSRLYAMPSDERPLAGLRFAVKDLIDVAGSRTGCGSNQYRELYGPKETTAPYIQRLIDAGAAYVGKTKPCMFGDGVDPVEWGDILAPLNPRGDSFQNPSSSSAGSAVACAAYSWLDFTIGTDTGGSIRHPAGVNGTYGTRPSRNWVTENRLGHIMPGSTAFDTVGVFARSGQVLREASKYLVDPEFANAMCRLDPISPTEPPAKFRLLYPVRGVSADPGTAPKWFPNPQSAPVSQSHAVAEAHFEQFVTGLESVFDIQRTVFSMAELWRTTRPQELSADLDEAIGTLYEDIVYHDCVRNVVDPFIADWKARFRAQHPDAAAPPPDPWIVPIVKARMDYGRRVTAADYRAANAARERFATWVVDTLFRAHAQPGETPLLIFPQSWGIPAYRHELPTAAPPPQGDRPLFWSGFSLYSIAYCSGCPDFTVPVGEVPYESTVTGRREWLPCSVSLLSAPGNDGVLLNLLQSLEERGVLRPQVTGARMYA